MDPLHKMLNEIPEDIKNHPTHDITDEQGRLLCTNCTFIAKHESDYLPRLAEIRLSPVNVTSSAPAFLPAHLDLCGEHHWQTIEKARAIGEMVRTLKAMEN